jgi:hypothetical protein
MYLISLVPGLASLLIFVPHGTWPGGNTWLIAIGFLVLLTVSGWLFSRIYYLSSIVLTQNGVEQCSVGFPNQFKRRVRLGWDEITAVSFSGLSFHFVGAQGERLELNTSLFNDMQGTIRTVRNLLPARLQAQLQG